MLGRRTSGFHQPGRYCLHQARSAGRCSASRLKVNYILPRTARKTDFGTLCLLSCLRITAPMKYFAFWRGHSTDSNRYYYVTASWVPRHINTTWCYHSPCAELGFSTPHNMIYQVLDNNHVDRQKNKKRYPGCLAHAVIGMFYSAVANQRQPQYKI